MPTSRSEVTRGAGGRTTAQRWAPGLGVSGAEIQTVLCQPDEGSHSCRERLPFSNSYKDTLCSSTGYLGKQCEEVVQERTRSWS